MIGSGGSCTSRTCLSHKSCKSPSQISLKRVMRLSKGSRETHARTTCVRLMHASASRQRLMQASTSCEHRCHVSCLSYILHVSLCVSLSNIPRVSLASLASISHNSCVSHTLFLSLSLSPLLCVSLPRVLNICFRTSPSVLHHVCLRMYVLCTYVQQGRPSLSNTLSHPVTTLRVRT